jgi:hypothetical protein
MATFGPAMRDMWRELDPQQRRDAIFVVCEGRDGPAAFSLPEFKGSAYLHEDMRCGIPGGGVEAALVLLLRRSQVADALLGLLGIEGWLPDQRPGKVPVVLMLCNEWDTKFAGGAFGHLNVGDVSQN